MKKKYDPFSKSYQILCFQEQVAHKKNLKLVKSINQSNLKIIDSFKENNHASKKVPSGRKRSSSVVSMKTSQIIEPYRVIHKNQSYDRSRNDERISQNKRMAAKLMNTTCSVITRERSLKQYQEHKIYEQIARKYSKNGFKKNFMNIDLSSSLFSRSTCSRKMSQSKAQFETKEHSFYDSNLRPEYRY